MHYCQTKINEKGKSGYFFPAKVSPFCAVSQLLVRPAPLSATSCTPVLFLLLIRRYPRGPLHIVFIWLLIIGALRSYLSR